MGLHVGALNILHYNKALLNKEKKLREAMSVECTVCIYMFWSLFFPLFARFKRIMPPFRLMPLPVHASISSGQQLKASA